MVQYASNVVPSDSTGFICAWSPIAVVTVSGVHVWVMRIHSFINDQVSLNSRCPPVPSYPVGCHLIPDKATVTMDVQKPHGVWNVKQRFTTTVLYKKNVELLALSCVKQALLILFNSATNHLMSLVRKTMVRKIRKGVIYKPCQCHVCEELWVPVFHGPYNWAFYPAYLARRLSRSNIWRGMKLSQLTKL